jgi:hypothetical protein
MYLKSRAVNRSCAIFLTTTGSMMGVSVRRGHPELPRLSQPATLRVLQPKLSNPATLGVLQP